jgi:hypothetical protein
MRIWIGSLMSFPRILDFNWVKGLVPGNALAMVAVSRDQA